MKEEKYRSTALERGLSVLRILGTKQLTLSQLSNKTSIPHATLLRLLSSLEKSEFIEKNPKTKKYHSTWILVPKTTSDKYRVYINDSLREATNVTGLTSEWYIPFSDRMVISDRCESNRPINVRARIGYTRILNDELEAVTQAALSMKDVDILEAGNYWHWENRTISLVTPQFFYDTINRVKQSRVSIDNDYNIFGIRRYAAVVLNPDNTLFGIIALAEAYTPTADERRDFNLKTLQQVAEGLQNKLQKIKE